MKAQVQNKTKEKWVDNVNVESLRIIPSLFVIVGNLSPFEGSHPPTPTDLSIGQGLIY